ncbi:MAG: Ribosomal protein L18 [Candidatus Methanohalarchaeum thermophilum]|uniref:Large ribosomal subunit protein uL18 n=1 Tax=Methanohalarchaeum thermophilum TaxID=1903181 RepID=A0A1Q6DX16_METT1|nr:MAG: Ribosomal protein L18 [Candidatus Methanohalarchaeum thermophilum]
MNSRERIPPKRRREGKTDYSQRLDLLKSGKPRLVVRKTNKHFRAQLVIPSEEGDNVITQAHTKNLEEYGWKASTSNTPAAYLVGYLAGKKIKSRDITEVIPDIGLDPITKGSSLFAVIEGVRDAGISAPVSEKIIPSKDRIRGEHIASYAESKEKEFNSYEIDPSKLPDHFEEIKNNINQDFGE